MYLLFTLWRMNKSINQSINQHQPCCGHFNPDLPKIDVGGYIEYCRRLSGRLQRCQGMVEFPEKNKEDTWKAKDNNGLVEDTTILIETCEISTYLRW